MDALRIPTRLTTGTDYFFKVPVLSSLEYSIPHLGNPCFDSSELSTVIWAIIAWVCHYTSPKSLMAFLLVKQYL